MKTKISNTIIESLLMICVTACSLEQTVVIHGPAQTEIYDNYNRRLGAIGYDGTLELKLSKKYYTAFLQSKAPDSDLMIPFALDYGRGTYARDAALMWTGLCYILPQAWYGLWSQMNSDQSICDYKYFKDQSVFDDKYFKKPVFNEVTPKIVKREKKDISPQWDVIDDSSTATASIENNNTQYYSDENDSFLYNLCYTIQCDSNGKFLEDTQKKESLSDGEYYQIQFEYAKNITKESLPIRIKLSKFNSVGSPVMQEILGYIPKSDKSAVKFKESGVNIYVGRDWHIHVRPQFIIVYKTKNDKYVSARQFNANNATAIIYEARYEVLVEKLKQIFQD